MRARRRVAVTAVACAAAAASAAAFTLPFPANAPAPPLGTPAQGNEPPPAASAAPVAPVAPTAPGKPNIVMITVDDMTISDLAHMPRTRRLLAGQGTTLTGAVAPTPICVPARASLVTGQYAHNHGALTIRGAGGGIGSFEDQNTLPVWLRKAGYSTMFAGKYLNGYGQRDPSYVPPGWSSWRGSIDPSTYSYNETRFSIDGRVVQPRGYSTDIIAGYTTRMITNHRSTRADRPFFVWANYVAPHFANRVESDDPMALYPNDPGANVPTPTPARRHRDMFAGTPLPRAPEVFRDTRGSAYATNKAVTPQRIAAYRELHAQRLESLQSVDEAVGRTVATLRNEGILSRTLLIFTSDNGYLVGHHNRYEKLVPYYRSLRIPVIVRGPGVPIGTRVSTPVTNPDIAVSVAAAAHATPGRDVDGIDMISRLVSHPRARRIVPIEAYPIDGGTTPLYTGIMYGPWTYVRNRDGSEELFDRRRDSAELANVVRAHPAVASKLRAANRRYRDCAGATCPKTLNPRL